MSNWTAPWLDRETARITTLEACWEVVTDSLQLRRPTHSLWRGASGQRVSLVVTGQGIDYDQGAACTNHSAQLGNFV
eukprot:6196100-Pleurochrysis_carterae.AAC.1